MPPKRRKSRKRNKNNLIKYLIFGVMILLIGSVLISQSNGVENYVFYEKLKQLNNSENNYTKLIDQINILCEKELSPDEKNTGNLSVEFLENLTFFSRNWKGNESIAQQYAKNIDDIYTMINANGLNSSEIRKQINDLYDAEMNNLGYELEIQNTSINNTTSLVKQLEQDEKNLITTLEKKKIEEEKKKNDEINLSFTYKQKMNESKNSELNLSFSTNDYQKVKNSFNDNLFPYLILGIVVGGITGFVLIQRWKKEIIYWDAYSSSAEVRSPLIYAAAITVALVIISFIYLFLSGILTIILAG